jgi:hypothetical protein
VLTLRRLERHGVWFADRPSRRSGVFLSSSLAPAWKGLGFVSEPPNAALVYPDPDGAGSTVILELRAPRYNRRRNTLSFKAKWIDPRNVRSRNLAPHAKSADPAPDRSFTDASLFIDDATAPVVNGCIIQPYTQCDGVDLHNADLHQAALSYADLVATNLNGATLAGANLAYANLATAKLQVASLAGANLTNANLADADFPGASFAGANLDGANLAGGVATIASLAGAYFCDTRCPTGPSTTPAVIALPPLEICRREPRTVMPSTKEK